jgi:pimeloyl-ACP methyl ester carboxylesterase
MGTYRIDRLAADLDEVLTALNVTAPLTLVGHSMGAMAALAYLSRPASERSVDPHGLVLVAAAAGKLAQRGLGRLLGTRAWHRVGRYSWCSAGHNTCVNRRWIPADAM